MKIKRFGGIKLIFSHGDHKFIIDFGKDAVSFTEAIEQMYSELERAQENCNLGGVEKSLLARAAHNWVSIGAPFLYYDSGN
jgi:hypothetical protein